MPPRSGTETVVVTLKELKVGSWTVVAGRFWRGGCGGACAYTRDAQPRRIAVNASDRMRTSVQPSLDYMGWLVNAAIILSMTCLGPRFASRPTATPPHLGAPDGRQECLPHVRNSSRWFGRRHGCRGACSSSR